MDLDIPRDRSTLLEQLLDMAIMASYASGQFLINLWRLLKGTTYDNNEDDEYMEDVRPSRSYYRRQEQEQEEYYDEYDHDQDPHDHDHQSYHQEVGEGDFLRVEERLQVELSSSDTKFEYPRLVCVVCGFPKDFRLYPRYVRGKFGEDAWFYSSTPLADTMGVADGVGGWRSYGIDPGEFSQFLMRACQRMSKYRTFHPRRLDLLMKRAYLDLLHQKCPVLGSATVCLLSLHREASTIYTANIGDSGFLVVRSGRILCRSLEQQHQFNTPYQLASPPPIMGGHFLIDSPDCADCHRFTTRPGDVVLLATDGVFDNVPLSLLVACLSDLAFEDDRAVIQMTANSIALMARTLSLNQKYDSPFSKNARKMNIDIIGGKPDDITVLLSTVV